MSTAKLNVWVTGVGEACRIDNEHQWFVHILHCNGELLHWCDRTFTNLPTKCGHLDIEIPPGCYMVVATWSPAPGGGQFPTFLGNHITHLSVVRADCGDHVCVTLFPPTLHHCGIWWKIALEEHMEHGRFENREVVANAARAVQAVLNLEEVAIEPFTANLLANIRGGNDKGGFIPRDKP